MSDEKNNMDQTPIENIDEEFLIDDESNENKVINIEVRIQKVEILIDKAEQEYLLDDENEELYAKYKELKTEYKQLLKERKQILKENAKQDQSTLEQVSMWVVIYGVISIIISLPFLTGQLWLSFANDIMSLFSTSGLGLDPDDFIYKVLVFLIIFAFPLLLNVITWFIKNNFINKKADKKVYIICWIIQGVMSIGMIIYMSIQLYS